MNNIDKFRQDFAEAQENPPAIGTILRPYGDDDVAKLVIDLQEGKEPFIYGQAYVPCIVGMPVKGWCLQTPDIKGVHGLRCILLTRARDAIIRKYPNLPSEVHVKSLKVVRYTRKGSAMLCEVHEFCPEQEQEQEQEQASVD